MAEEKNEQDRGGKRRGAGRKPGPLGPVLPQTICLPASVWAMLWDEGRVKDGVHETYSQILARILTSD